MSVLEDALLGFPSHGGSAGGLVLLSLADLPAHGELPADSVVTVYRRPGCQLLLPSMPGPR
jgi:hypothetical protein